MMPKMNIHNNSVIESSEFNPSLLGKCFINSGDYIWGDLFDQALELGPGELSLLSSRRIYFRRVMEVVLKNVKNSKLVFYISFHLHSGIYSLPSYGDNVISLVVGDEWYRIPLYINKLKAVFKSQGSNPTYLLQGLSKPYRFSYIDFLVWLHFVKTLRHYLPSLTNYLLIKLRTSVLLSQEKVAPIYDIPLGYGSQLDLPIKCIDEREFDVFFGGSILHRKYSPWSLKAWMSTHKRLSRERMIQSVMQLQSKYPEWNFETLTRDTYEETQQLNVNDGYSERMMNAKVCLVPRGVTLDTCRLFEALRYGCVIVADSLPSTWFYDGLPAIKVNDWKELETVLKVLLADKELLRQRHEETLKWWHTKCSEEVVGKFIADRINSLS
jgi:hypothetical protein